MQVVSNVRSVVNVLAIAEPLLTILVLAVFLRAKDHLRFPALLTYLVLRVASSIVLTGLLNLTRLGVTPHVAYAFYFYTYWSLYLAGAIAIFFVIQEMFKHVMSPLPGISRLGLIAFRWAATISLIVAIASAVLPSGVRGRMIMTTSIEFMRCVSLMELCLLALLAFCVHALGLSFRSRAFGVGLGLGLTAFIDFTNSVFALGQKSMNSPANMIAGIVTTFALLSWTIYFLLPERERRPLTLPMTSPLMRWNEIALALGHSSPQVAVGQSSQFFLQDVESVVDKMLTKNSMNIVN